MTAFSNCIEEIVGPENIRTDIRERTVNAVDIGVMPKLVRPFIPAGLPGAVVRPETEQQICDIVKASRDAGIPLTVRAGATSGYGGVLPKEGATVIDLSGWDKIISLDSTARTVRCQASAIWEEIDTEIAKHGFELALYPSSYPSSTVGGWLAQGGGGFGSYEYGTFKENVVSVRVITPEGNPVEVSAAKALDLIADAEGITGIITEVTFKVRPLEKTVVKLASFSTTKALGAAFADLKDHGVPLWSVTFFNPTSVKLKKKLPSRKTHLYMQEEVERERTMLNAMPETYLALFAYPTSRSPQVTQSLETAVRKQGGTFLSDEQAEMEWADRTNAMRLKRLGPSIIPTEVIVPLDEMATVLDEIDQKIDQPFVLEGMLSNSANDSARNGARVDARSNTPSTDVVLLGYIPHDERTFNFNMAFVLALSVMKIANDHHGNCYATGLYFRDQAENLLGTGKCDRLRAYKHAHDPKNILSPGKVLFLDGERGGVLGWLMRTAMRFERTIRPIANAAKPSEKPAGGTRNGISSEVGLDAMRCARCGYCVHTCEQYSGRGWESNSPRGKYTWLQEIYEGRQKWDKAAADTMLLCTTCERCDFRCQLHLPVAEDGMCFARKW